jgi:hypothetical protein
MVRLFVHKTFLLTLFLTLLLGIILYLLIQVDVAKKLYAEKVEQSKPVIEIKINKK